MVWTSHRRHEFGRDLVGDDDAHHLAFPQPAALDLEIDELDAGAEEEAGEEVVDADGERHDVVDLLRACPAEGRDVLLRHHRVVELVVLVIELDDRARQNGAFFHAEALRQRARGDVANHHLERDDLDFADQLLAHVEAPDEVRRDAHAVEVGEDVLGDAVVEDALAVNDLVLLLVERGGVVLEELDQGAGLRPLEQNLALAFVDAPTAIHGHVPRFVKIHCRVPGEKVFRYNSLRPTQAAERCRVADLMRSVGNAQ